MAATGQWSPSQLMGRRWPIGRVALEITQRCNLDCTACYLSEQSEAVKDIPLEEVFRRIDMIFDHYGPHTDVQVTGGDPTLRKRDELVAIVRRIRDKGMRPTLFTNGIRAKRSLLQELVAAGLVDVAFHVDMTQRRHGYGDEIALDALRQEYIERTRRLGLPRALFDEALERTARLPFDRQNRSAAVRTLLKGVLTSPRLTLRGAAWLGRKIWRARGSLVRAPQRNVKVEPAKREL